MGPQHNEHITTGELHRLFVAARESEDTWRKEMRESIDKIGVGVDSMLKKTADNEREIAGINDILHGKDRRSGMVSDVGFLKTFHTTVKAWAALLSLIGVFVFSLCILYVKLYMETAVRKIIKEEIDAVLTEQYEIQIQGESEASKAPSR